MLIGNQLVYVHRATAEPGSFPEKVPDLWSTLIVRSPEGETKTLILSAPP